MSAFVDLRSDTVTKPTDAMRKAMASAEVGDDVYGEDPTILALEARVAELLGKESALYVPSGTMANQIALMLHCKLGDAVFCGKGTHMALYESGASSAFAGVQFFEAKTGVFGPEDLAEVVLPDVFYYPRPRLLAVENTHNHSGGRVFPQETLAATVALAREHKLVVHLDGARLWNAATALDVSPAAIAAHADTVSVCFSKGLGAPMGSAVAMNADRREEALRYRRRMGGALRQAGIVAAGALHALDHHMGDLATDHKRARRFAELLRDGGASCGVVETNIVVFRVDPAVQSAAAFTKKLAPMVGLGAISPTEVRAVTHRDLDDASIERAAKAILAAL